MKNLPKTSKKPPQNLPKASQNEIRNRPGTRTSKKNTFFHKSRAPFGSVWAPFLLFFPLGPIKKNEYFRSLPGSAIGTILGAFWSNFNDFSSAKTMPEDDLGHLSKPFNFMRGVIEMLTGMGT